MGIIAAGILYTVDGGHDGRLHGCIDRLWTKARQGDAARVQGTRRQPPVSRRSGGHE